MEKERRFTVNGIGNTGFYYTMQLIRGKYKLPVLYWLYLNGTTWYNELKRQMETAAFHSLANVLKKLEATESGRMQDRWPAV
ncbi:MAG: hypothetical protein HFG28_12310 [Eubacterium sp.]|nr:hypothetical protein [Eubacterium sp.]